MCSSSTCPSNPTGIGTDNLCNCKSITEEVLELIWQYGGIDGGAS